jgi:hypothetical protein
MSSLRELQAAFVAGVFDDQESGAQSYVLANGMPPEARLAIYRNNIFHNYQQALRDVYPVVERLVGEEFFAFAAKRYIPCHPSHHGNLHCFGAEFGTFLDGFAPAAALPYLGDIARLEWHVHEVFHAADRDAMRVQRLAALPIEKMPHILCTLHPACRLFASPFPVDRIWQLNQPDAAADETIDLDAGRVWLLIRRRGFVIEVEALDEAQFALLAAFRDGLTLQQALARALAVAPEFDFAGFLQRRVGDATVVDCLVAAP